MIIKFPFIPFEIIIRRLRPKIEKYKATPIAIIESKNYDKIFCVGAGKTGTTSMEKLLKIFGFKMGDQTVGEMLSRDWLINNDSDRVIRFCQTADAFQDAPFGLPGLYEELDKAFPNSKFILTVRNSADEWFESLVRFQTKKFSSDPNRPPNEEDLKNATYRYKGYILESKVLNWGYPKVPLYDKEIYMKQYLEENNKKREYFKNRPNDFIEINLSVKSDFKRLCDFLGIKTNLEDFPIENQSK